MTGSTVLLTATVRPNTQLFVAEDQAEVRLAQYRSAIADWASVLRQERTDLVIVETSGASADDLLVGVPVSDRGRIQVLDFDVAGSDPSKGKGRLEADAILHAVRAVERAHGSEWTVHKATGRLLLSNRTRLVRPLAPDVVQVRMTVDRSFADTRFLGASTRLWRDVVLADADQVDDERGVFLEHVVAAAVGRASALRRIRIESFPERPVFAGRSGSTGRQYRRGVVDLVPSLTRFAERKLATLAARKQV